MLRGKTLRWIGLVAVIILALVCFGIEVLNPFITAWVNGPRFHKMLDKETSKGLKLEAHYGTLTRVGTWGMQVDRFDGTNGDKTIVSLHAEDISGAFDPLGIPLHRWQVDDIHIRKGTVTIQKTDTPPGSAKKGGMPWWGIFWPYRVQLQDVKCDDAQVLWQLNDKESGIYHTFLEITPNGHDFEYDARGGDFKTPLTPTLEVRHIHLLIRKPRLWCTEFILGDDPAHPDQQLRMTGEAGLQEDRSMKLKLDLVSLNVSPWLPPKLRSHILGHAEGHFEYASTGTGLETGKGQGHLRLVGGVLHELGPIRQYLSLTNSPDPGDLKLKTCELDVKWDAGAITAENIQVESEGVFQVHGTLTLAKDKTLQGNIELGLTDPYIKWLPTAKTAIFTRTEGDYHFTTIHFSGTSKAPKQDLTDRVVKEVGKSPFLTLKLFFNAAGDWFNFD